MQTAMAMLSHPDIIGFSAAAPSMVVTPHQFAGNFFMQFVGFIQDPQRHFCRQLFPKCASHLLPPAKTIVQEPEVLLRHSLRESMKRTFFLIAVLCTVPLARAEHIGVYQQGTVVRMRMGECVFPHHGFMATMSGQSAQISPDLCPEYTLISEKVVFVIMGTSSNQLIPLADVLDFRVRKNELAVRLDDAKHESRFSIKEMILRSEWDLVQKHITDELSAPPHPNDDVRTTRTRN